MAVNLTRQELKERQQDNTQKAIERGKFEEGLASSLAFVNSPSDVDSQVIADFEENAVESGVGEEFVENFEQAIK